MRQNNGAGMIVLTSHDDREFCFFLNATVVQIMEAEEAEQARKRLQLVGPAPRGLKRSQKKGHGLGQEGEREAAKKQRHRDYCKKSKKKKKKAKYITYPLAGVEDVRPTGSGLHKRTSYPIGSSDADGNCPAHLKV